MADPIVMDCGGSTRIKRIESGGSYGDMAGLLDVHALAAEVLPRGVGAARGAQEVVTPPPTKMQIVFQDSTGTPYTVPVTPLPGNFVISSILKQKVSGDFSAPGKLTISVFSTDVDPLVEAKQSKDAAGIERRRYVVANAAAILTVSLNVSLANPAGDLWFDACNPTKSPGVRAAGLRAAQIVGPAIYVSVVLS